jgi:hypothetical protein
LKFSRKEKAVIEQESKGSFSRFLAYLDLLPLDESQKVQIGSLAMTYKDTFAAAQVAEKEDQITRILSENRALEMTRQRLLFACDANQKAIAAKDARIQELELVIEYAASSLDLIHPDDSDFMEKLNKIYQNLENKTRYEV